MPRTTTPKIITVDDAETVKQVQDAIALLTKYKGVLQNAPNGWIVVASTNWTKREDR